MIKLNSQTLILTQTGAIGLACSENIFIEGKRHNSGSGDPKASDY